MKQSRLKKEKLRNLPRVRITYERDYDDEAWLNESKIVPTPETHPNAFYPVSTTINPHPQKASLRREHYNTLSKRHLAKRLYAAGVRGKEVKRIAAEIKAGPGLSEFEMGTYVMGWNVEAFKSRFGPRIARFVFKLVKRKMIFIDELAALFASAEMSRFITSSMTAFRKVSGKVLEVTQTLPA